MPETAKITSKNQITLPAEVRKSLGVGSGDVVDFVRNTSGNFELRVRRETLSDLRGILKADHSLTGHELETWIAEARAAGGEPSDDRD
ncbi:AbrB/MazE/SpoVT family DNA-binding domain-containing protein [Agrobacterium sp. a22-2]|uniref:AbrB/MazE/SpoVT family DNA-binding domain-containing protein n=1 Tax=Agrobacterium sp. a22-2 TaxID=2283840 RepID=UPI001445FDC3|nr:AbrB/MazE/SpoVT family DNA-binding domain-containing protein [Agrobacterium sp. a22-2]NKN35721.1 AbrB/MazE/SpoVT family DNA-binding domain-containing protein [Agrobacterium sp. a22-2]